MHFVSFETDGIVSWGRLEGETIVDLSGVAPDLKSAIAAGLPSLGTGGPQYPRSQVQLLPVIPGKIFYVGHNYEDHRIETGRASTDFPSIFTRFSNTLIDADCPIVRPIVSTDLDYEAELAVVIGKGGRNIAEADAMNHVAGYSCFSDASVRDWQWHTRQFIPGKNFPGTRAIGPAPVTPTRLQTCSRSWSNPTSTGHACRGRRWTTCCSPFRSSSPMSRRSPR